MTTRLYPTFSFSSPVAIYSGWNATAGRCWKVGPTKFTNPDNPATSWYYETVATPIDIMQYQLITDALKSDTTISGTVKGQFLAQEYGSAQCRAQVYIRVLSNDFATVRGTLLGFDTGALSSEFINYNSGYQNRKFPRGGAQSLSSVSALAGDYIVIEVGARAHNTTTSNTGHNIPVCGAGADLPEDETSILVYNTYTPWIEFSQDFVFEDPKLRFAFLGIQISSRDKYPPGEGWGIVLN